MILCVSQLVPLLILELIPPLRSGEEVRAKNLRGLTQRLSVLGIMVFTASYAWDIKGMQERLKYQEEAAAVEEVITVEG